MVAPRAKRMVQSSSSTESPFPAGQFPPPPDTLPEGLEVPMADLDLEVPVFSELAQAEAQVPRCDRLVLYSGPQEIIEAMPHMDLLLDARGFVDPQTDLRNHSGLHAEIRSRIRGHDNFLRLKQILEEHFQDHLLPSNGVAGHYRVGVFCRAGRHRSVGFCEEIAMDLRAAGMVVRVVHLNDDRWPCKRGRCQTCVEVFSQSERTGLGA